MKKQYRVCIATALTVILILCSVFPAYATSTSNITKEIVTKRSDGSIVTTTFTYSPNSSRSLLNESDLIAPAYETLNTYINAGEENDDNGIMLLADNYGRTHLTGSNVDQRIGYLYCEFDIDGDGVIDTRSAGTASLQNHDILISCAHVVWKKHLESYACNGWATNITFYNGRTSATVYSASSSYASVSIGSDYINNSTWGYDADGNRVSYPYYEEDWSILQLQNDLGGTYGWFGLHGCGSPVEDNLAVTMIGYPSDHPYQQWSAEGVISSFEGNKVYYNVYNYPGASGSPVINSRYVYAINTFMVGEPSDRNSGGTRMSPWMFELIVFYRKLSEARWE